MAAFVNKRFSPVSAVTIDQVSFVSGVTALNDILSLCMTDGETDGLLLAASWFMPLSMVKTSLLLRQLNITSALSKKLAEMGLK
ncbi:unnamed protein product [Alternaria alternata]